jgi:hypothetical protein
VAGYAVEYGSTPYMLFYLAETSNIVLMSGLMAVLFLGGWQRRGRRLPGAWPPGWPACTACLLSLKTFRVSFMNAMVPLDHSHATANDQLDARWVWKGVPADALVSVFVVSGRLVYTSLSAMRTALISSLPPWRFSGCRAASPQLDGGVATYDAIKSAQKECEAKGKVFRLKRNGNAQYLEDYACRNEKK